MLMDSGPAGWQSVRKPLRLLIWLLIAVTCLAIYSLARDLVGHVFSVLLVFVFAMIVALVLDPLIDLVQRVPPFRRHRGLAVLALYASGGALLVLLGLLVGPSLVDEAHQLPVLGQRFQAEVTRLGIPIGLTRFFQPAGSSVDLGAAVGALTAGVTVVVDVILVVVISIYLLVQGRTVVATLRNLFPAHTRRFDFIFLTIGSTISAYVRGQLIMSLIIGTYTAMALSILGVHYAIVIGVAAALLEFLPLIGAVVAMALGVAVALLQSPTLAILAAAVGLFGHAMEAYIIGPRVNGHVTQLHPLVAMASLLIGAEVGGVLGALFAVPVAAIANVFLGALYRSRQGQEALSTGTHGEVDVDSLPRLGEEIGVVGSDGVEGGPLPHQHAG